MMLVKGAVLGFFTQRFMEVARSYAEALWRLYEVLRFRRISYDAVALRLIFYTEIHRDTQEIQGGFNPLICGKISYLWFTN